MNANHASLPEPSVEDSNSPAIAHGELRWLIDDFESLVAAGVLQGARQEAAQFFSGWLAFEDHGCASPDSLRLIVLPGFPKGQ